MSRTVAIFSASLALLAATVAAQEAVISVDPPAGGFDPYGGAAPVITDGGVLGTAPVLGNDPFTGACAPSGWDQGVQRGFFAFGELFRWETNQPFTPYVVDSSGVAPVAMGSFGAATVDSADYGTDTGLRVGLGYRNDSGWDTGVTATFFDNDGFAMVGDRTVDSDDFLALDANQVVLLGPPTIFVNAGRVDEASQSLGLDYEVYDLEVGKVFVPDHATRLRFFGGVRLAEIDQTQRTTYVNLEGAATEFYVVDTNIDMEAAGLRAGFGASRRLLGSGFIVFVRSSASLLAADFNVTRRDTAINAAGTEVFLDSGGDFEQIVPVMEIAAGARWESDRFFVSGGYEVANWFNMVTRARYTTNGGFPQLAVDHGDLGFQGWFVRVGWNR